jgi:hypothetical protein
MNSRKAVAALPVDTLIDGEPFDDIDGFLFDHAEGLSASDCQALDDVIHGRRTSAYIGGGHLPVWFICGVLDAKG